MPDLWLLTCLVPGWWFWSSWLCRAHALRDCAFCGRALRHKGLSADRRDDATDDQPACHAGIDARLLAWDPFFQRHSVASLLVARFRLSLILVEGSKGLLTTDIALWMAIPIIIALTMGKACIL
jgi:hypothetical protein